jgi:hypothetical protein
MRFIARLDFLGEHGEAIGTADFFVVALRTRGDGVGGILGAKTEVYPKAEKSTVIS